MKIHGIYLITVGRTGLLPLYYVGQSNNVKLRISSHYSALRAGRHPNSYMQRAWEKYGESAFSSEVLETAEISQLDSLEQWWIDEMFSHQRCMNQSNYVNGFTRGIPFTDEHRRKIAEAISGDKHYNFGKKLSADHKKKISKGGLGLKRTKETCERISRHFSGTNNPMFGKSGSKSPRSRAVMGVRLTDGAVVEYESAHLAEKDGFIQESISRACNGVQHTHKGYRWSFMIQKGQVEQLSQSPVRQEVVADQQLEGQIGDQVVQEQPIRLTPP